MSIRIMSLAFLALLVAGESRGEEQPSTNPLPTRWQVVYRPRGKTRKPVDLPANSMLDALTELKLDGVPDADPNWLRNYQVDGDWGVVNGLIQQRSGQAAALKIADAEGFELDAFIDAGGVGGWFLLFGWDEGHGYVLYNVQLKTSGSVWMFAELRNGKMIPETHRKVSNYVWGGPLRMQFVVDKGMATLKAGNATILKEIELENYHSGALITGTYSSQYGPKKLRLGAMRIRGR